MIFLSFVINYVLFTFTFSYIACEVFSSIYRIQLALDAESHLIAKLEWLIETEKKEGQRVPEHVDSFFKEAKMKNTQAISDSDYASNPINDLHIMERFVNGWTVLPQWLFCEDCFVSHNIQEYNKFHNKTWSEYNMPNDEDLEQVADSLGRLQEMYNLDLDELYDGRIKDTQTDPLQPRDILYITDVFDSKDMYEKEIVWLLKLIERFNNGRQKVDFPQQRKFYKRLARTYFLAGLVNSSVDSLTEYMNAAPDDEHASKELAWYKLKQRENVGRTITRYTESRFDVEDDPEYIKLCNGQELRTPRQEAKLKCFYRNTKIPYLRAKQEVLNIRPMLIIYHDVISNNESKALISIVKTKLGRSEVVAQSGQKVKHRIRISQTAWIDDTNDAVVKRLTKRIEYLTGLSTKLIFDAEGLQVLNYGVGGLYIPHLDILGSTRSQWETGTDSGDRIATWMFYLSDVKYGGSTVFPRMKVGIPVNKGAAAFWYNMLQDGTADTMSLHAGCPVLIGSKWVSNKWIRSNGQFRNRPCDLFPKQLRYT